MSGVENRWSRGAPHKQNQNQKQNSSQNPSSRPSSTSNQPQSQPPNRNQSTQPPNANSPKPGTPTENRSGANTPREGSNGRPNTNVWEKRVSIGPGSGVGNRSGSGRGGQGQSQAQQQQRQMQGQGQGRVQAQQQGVVQTPQVGLRGGQGGESRGAATENGAPVSGGNTQAQGQGVKKDGDGEEEVKAWMNRRYDEIMKGVGPNQDAHYKSQSPSDGPGPGNKRASGAWGTSAKQPDNKTTKTGQDFWKDLQHQIQALETKKKEKKEQQ